MLTWTAFSDPVVWLYLTLQFTCFLIVGSLAVFSNIIVNGLGFTVRQTQLLNLAQGGWSVFIYICKADLMLRSALSLTHSFGLACEMEQADHYSIDLLHG